MTKKILITLLFIVPQCLQAQVRIAPAFGINTTKSLYKDFYTSYRPGWGLGYQGGAFADIKIAKRVNILTGTLLSIRSFFNEAGATSLHQSVFSLALPVNILYSIKLKKSLNLVLGAGPQFDITIGGLQQSKTVDTAGMQGDVQLVIASGAEFLAPVELGVNFIAGLRRKNGFMFTVQYTTGRQYSTSTVSFQRQSFSINLIFFTNKD